MTASVWLVECGYYDDGRVVGAFSSESAALAFCALIGDGRCSEWPIVDDAAVPPPGSKRWRVRLTSSGEVLSVIEDEVPYYVDVAPSCVHYATRWNSAEKRQEPVDEFEIDCWAMDAQHAVKIAIENMHAQRAVSL